MTASVRLRRTALSSTSALGLAVLAMTSTAAAQSGLPTAVPAAKLVDIAHARNVVILDSVVFLLGVGICVGVLAWWGRRIFTEK